MKQYILILGAFILTIGAVSAQTSKIKRAHKAFEDLNYQEAIDLYSQVLSKQDDAQAKINIAECYRKVSNTQEAEYWYGQVVNLAESEAVHKLFYGQMLQTNGKCDLAKEWYKKYVEEVPDDLRGQYLVRACDYEEELMTKNEGVYEIEHMPFNTNLDDFSPNIYGDGVVYASEYRDAGVAIKRAHTWTGNPFLELFYVTRNRTKSKTKEYEYEYGSADKFSSRLNSKYHDAAVTFNSDESEIYFTRNNIVDGRTGRDDDGAIRLKIFSAQNNGGSAWSNIEGLPFNSDEYSVAHPALSIDGEKLYFASDMPGGFGGMDLYVTEQDNGRWGPPVNLGPGINTEGHEVFPYVSKDNKFYFASDGHVGLGGLDIYYMVIQDNEEFGEITNMGFPINTISDDFGIVLHEDGKFGYFSSDRDGGLGGDDIYSFTKMAAPVRLFVYDEETGTGIESAKVINECTGTEFTTNSAGFVEFDQKIGVCCNFVANAETYLENAKEGCTIDLEDGEGVIVEIPLKRPLEFDIEGIVYDEDAKQPIPFATVELVPTECADMNPQTVTADDKGYYYFKLDKACCYELKASNDPKYTPTRSKERCTKGLTESQTLKQDLALKLVPPPTPTPPPASVATTTQPRPGNNPNPAIAQTGVTTLQEFGEGRTPGTYLIHIYYDFDQSYIREDAIEELTRLYNLLLDNPSYVVEIGSHTDSRGSHSYNHRLSQRRAESVVRWLKDKGIPGQRMKPKGYGETINVNNCANNVPCSEEEHQWNRRTEFKILGYLDPNGDYNNVVESEKPNRVKVDACQGCPF